MQLLPVLLWPKPKARQPIQYYGNKNINLQFATRAFSTPVAPATITTTFLYAFVINALLLITKTWGLTTTQQPTSNYDGANANADVVSALTGLSNGYAAANYIKHYYPVTGAEVSKQQQLEQKRHQNNVLTAAVKLGHPVDLGASGIIGRSFVGLQPNNYGNSLNARGASVGAPGDEDMFNVYDDGFVPTSFTAAGQHYGASLVGLQAATDKINTLHQYDSNAANKNNLHANHQPYGNVNSKNKNKSNNNDDDVVAETNSNKAQHSSFRRLSKYGSLKNDGRGRGNTGDNSATNFDNADVDDDGGAVDGTGTGEVIQNYAMAYADDAQQSSLMQNFYNQQIKFNDDQSIQKQTFANYFPQSMAATAGYEIENHPKYYTLNNYQQTIKPQQQFAQHQYKQQTYELQQQPQQQQQAYNNLEILTSTPTPATYFQTYIQHKNDNKENLQQYRHVTADNYHRWKQNQITTNYQPEQSTIGNNYQPQQQQQKQEKIITTNNQYNQQHNVQEPETAETSLTGRIKKSPKQKSKRHDNNHDINGLNYSYDTPLEQTDNTIDHISNDISNIQSHQLEKLREELLQQQQQFIELQHQLIDHDQQLQIQKHVANNPAPTLPPITHTVHHSPHSLQALAGTPLAKHTQIIKNIPIPQLQQIHIPYRENVTIEIPDPVITPIRKPFAIQIPIMKTVTVPKVQEVKIPIEKLRPFPVERPIPYIVERRVPYAVEKQIAQPVYYPVPIKVPILHTVIHKIHKPPGPQHHHQPGYHVPHTVYQNSHGHAHGHGYGHGRGHGHGHGHGHSHYYLK